MPSACRTPLTGPVSVRMIGASSVAASPATPSKAVRQQNIATVNLARRSGSTEIRNFLHHPSRGVLKSSHTYTRVCTAAKRAQPAGNGIPKLPDKLAEQGRILIVILSRTVEDGGDNGPVLALDENPIEPN